MAPFPFTVHRAGDLSQAASVDYAVAGSGVYAADAADFGGVLPAGTIRFAPGETSKVIEVAASDDADFETDEGFAVALSNPGNVTIAGGSAAGRIVDDDNPVYVWIDPVEASQAEGDTGTTEFTFRVVRSGDLARGSSVDYQVMGDGEHPTDASDFGGSLPEGAIAFAPGQSEALIRVHVAGDTDTESTETFRLNLSNPQNALVSSGNAWGEVGNDDGTPQVFIAAISESKN